MEPAAASELALRLAWEAGRLVFRRDIEPDHYTVQAHYDLSLRDVGGGGWSASADEVPLATAVRKETALFACLVAEGMARRGYRMWDKPYSFLPLIEGRVGTLLAGGYLYRNQGDGRIELSRLAAGGRRIVGRYEAVGAAVLAATLAGVPFDLLAEPPPIDVTKASALEQSLHQAGAAIPPGDAVQSAREAVATLRQASQELDRLAEALRREGGLQP